MIIQFQGAPGGAALEFAAQLGRHPVVVAADQHGKSKIPDRAGYRLTQSEQRFLALGG
ncbi:hypothetical protein ACTWLT_19230 [Micromonospora sp. ZYX-F-536]|uniref:hypothetical protein n=1 Tax=Micromonospora sp. ZYX-F-536 TaxID=3457629 RepID=UPI004040A78C